jgi:HEXXH motif-containing protein
VVIRTSPEGADIDAPGGLPRVPADPWRDAPGWQGLRRLSARAGDAVIRFLVDDVDPYRMPVMDNVADRLTAEELRQLRDRLGPAWEMLAVDHWTAAEEIRTAIRAITPLQRPAEGQVSATARDVFGCVALSTPADAHAFAETLAHEVQHAKLTALLNVTPLTTPDDGSRFYAPWRDDPRPASGLLQGAYAYLGVAGFWRRRRALENGRAAGRAHAAFARWRDAAWSVTEILLASGRLTPAGEHFVCGMRGTLRAWRAEPVPRAALARARSDAERHMSRWRRRNGAALVRPEP